MVVELYTLCRNQWRFTSLGMGGAMRTGLSLSDVKIAAESSGIHLNDWILEKLNILVDEICKADAARMKSASTSNSRF